MSALTLKVARPLLKILTEETTAIAESLTSGRIALGIKLAEGRSLFARCPKLGDWKEWSATVAPNESRVNELCNAGTVASVIGDLGCSPSDRTLTAAYRVLSGAKTSEEVTAAEETLRGIWSQALAACERGKAPTEDQIRELCGDGSRGAKATSPAKGSKSKPKTDAKADDTADDDPAAREVAAKETRRVVNRWIAEGADPDTVALVMAGTVKLTESHGTAVMYAVAKALRDEQREAAKIATAAATLVESVS